MLDPRVILGQKPRKQALNSPRYFLWAGERDHAPYHAQTASCGKCLPANFESGR